MNALSHSFIVTGMAVLILMALHVKAEPVADPVQVTQATGSATDLEKEKREAERAAQREADRLRREAELNNVWSSLSTEEKAQMVRLFQGLRELPREESKTITDGINQFMRLPPDMREAARNNYKVWMSLTPQQRDEARNEYRRLKREFETEWKRNNPDTEPPAYPFRLDREGKVIPPARR